MWIQICCQVCALFYFLPFCSLPFHLLTSHRANILNSASPLIILGVILFWCHIKKKNLCLASGPKDFVCLLLDIFLFYMLHLDLWSPWDNFLKCEVHAFCFYLGAHGRMPSCFSTICWKDCPSSTECPLYLCQESISHIDVDLFLEFFSSFICVSLLLPKPHGQDCHTL